MAFAGLWCALLLLGSTTALPFLSDQFINTINNLQSSWTAGRNFPLDTPMEHFHRLMGLKLENLDHIPQRLYKEDVLQNLPKSFDPRDKWPHCPTLNEIRDQGPCGSCWAHAAVEAISDRTCISSGKKFHASADDLVSCVKDDGCQGGGLGQGWRFWIEHGLVSGGNYNTSEGCRPYEIPPCKYFTNGTHLDCIKKLHIETPECQTVCRDGYNKTFKQDKEFGKIVYLVNGDDHIMADLLHHGPMEIGMIVYEDFMNYKTGVYVHKTGNLLGAHAVKLMGWGEEGGQKYWLAANSWNTEWGDQGFFKILKNEDAFIPGAVGGEPLLK